MQKNETVESLKGLIKVLNEGITPDRSEAFHSVLNSAQLYIRSYNQTKSLNINTSKITHDISTFYAAVMEDICNRRVLQSPEIGSRWRHKNGDFYMVYDVTNEDSDRQGEDDYPTRVSYRREKDGKRWSRSLSKWYQSMTEVYKLTFWHHLAAFKYRMAARLRK